MSDTPFVGIGPNPEGKDLPLGFGMQLSQVPAAMEYYGRLSQKERDDIVTYIQNCRTGDDAKNRIAEVVSGLQNGISRFS